MKIIFWSEFPEQVNFAKLNKEIDFDTEVYFACKDKKEFEAIKKKVKNKKIKVGAWPILSKEEGYWFSGQTSRESIDKLDEFKGLKIKIDIEPRIFEGKYGILKTKVWLLKWILNSGKNKDYLLGKIKEFDKEDIIVSGFLLPRWIRARVGMEVECKKNFIAYSTFSKMLVPYYKFMIKRTDKNNFFAIGLSNPGIFGNEPCYKNKEEFRKDFENMKKLGANNLVVYSLEGTLKNDWLDVVKENLD